MPFSIPDRQFLPMGRVLRIDPRSSSCRRSRDWLRLTAPPQIVGAFCSDEPVLASFQEAVAMIQFPSQFGRPVAARSRQGLLLGMALFLGLSGCQSMFLATGRPQLNSYRKSKKSNSGPKPIKRFCRPSRSRRMLI